MSVRLHIDRLVVDGLPLTPRDRAVLGDAVQRELAVLLRASGGDRPRADLRVRRVQGGTVAPGRPARALGADIAGALHAGLRQVTGP